MADPLKLGDVVERVTKHLNSPEHAERVQSVETARQDRIAEQRAIELKRNAAQLWLERGTRYRDCSFDNFTITTDLQKTVVRKLLEFSGPRPERIAAEIAVGTNVVLVGPHGTGKDHLLAALMHAALAAKRTIKWTSGARLFANIRDDIERHTEELTAIRQYTQPDVLVISDPIWDGEPLTRGQRIKLGEIVDARYSNRRAIWVSINAGKVAEAADKMGAALVDRLRDGAVSLVCDWPTYRKSREL